MRILVWCVGGAILLSAAAVTPAHAQAANGRLRVYLDCEDDCFSDFVRTEIKWVDFVREPQDSDVQVLSSDRETGGGGREVVLRFVGHGRFGGVEQELRALSIVADPEDVQRRKVLEAMSVGFLGFLARQGLAGEVSLSVRPAERAAPAQLSRDPWNLWVFQIGGDGSVESEESNRQRTWEMQATADRVTDAWKISFGANLEEQRETFDLDEDEPLDVTRREREVEWFVARSISEHWSVGLDGNVASSTFGNVELGASFAPAVEFNVFPYSQYASRQLRIGYAAGVEHSRYIEVTLFDKFRETLGKHEFSVALDQREPWGTLQAGLQWSQYLHDYSKSRLELEGELSFRLARGFSIQVEGAVSRIRDQISLPRRDATPEEVLLRLRELQSGHEVSFSVGGAYSFGSIFNNIVNPRFGQ